VTLDTAAIQQALDDCKPAGGTVIFPPGTYLSEPLALHASHVVVELEPGATLLATTNQRAFMKKPGDWLRAKSSGDFVPFIRGEDLADVTFTGGGVIDGNGRVWWGEAEKARQEQPGYTLPRPNLIAIERTRNLTLAGITLQNSPKFHFVPTECEGVLVSNVTVLAPERAANTDAIDPSNCRDVLITHCVIDVGDDDVAVKSGKKVAGRAFGCENITVADCTILHGHGISIGSETVGGVRNVTVKNCTFANTENGLRIKSRPGRGGLVEQIFYHDITMSNVNPAITLTCAYANNSAGDAAQAVAPADDTAREAGKIPVYRNIRITNLTATCPDQAGIISGLPESCIANVVLNHVSISAMTGLVVRNARNFQTNQVSVVVKQGQPFDLKNAQVENLN
jgi:polygalacturonase